MGPNVGVSTNLTLLVTFDTEISGELGDKVAVATEGLCTMLLKPQPIAKQATATIRNKRKNLRSTLKNGYFVGLFAAQQPRINQISFPNYINTFHHYKTNYRTKKSAWLIIDNMKEILLSH